MEDEENEESLFQKLHRQGLWQAPAAFIGFLVLFVGSRACDGDQPTDRYGDAYLKGAVRADHPAIGTWNATPESCLSGRERGFDGVVFNFSSQSKIRELRVIRADPGSRYVEIHPANPKADSIRIIETECKTIESSYQIRNARSSGRQMDHLRGKVRIACPAYGLDAWFSFNGCTPVPW